MHRFGFILLDTLLGLDTHILLETLYKLTFRSFLSFPKWKCQTSIFSLSPYLSIFYSKPSDHENTVLFTQKNPILIEHNSSCWEWNELRSYNEPLPTITYVFSSNRIYTVISERRRRNLVVILPCLFSLLSSPFSSACSLIWSVFCSLSCLVSLLLALSFGLFCCLLTAFYLSQRTLHYHFLLC